MRSTTKENQRGNATTTATPASLRPPKPLLLLLLLFLLAFAVRAAFPDTSYFFWDETIYLLHGGLFAGHNVGYSELFQRPPLLPVLLSPFAGLASYETVSRLLVAFLNSLVVFPVYYLTKSVFSNKNALVDPRVDKGAASALIAAALIAFLPVHIINSRWVMTDALGAMLAFSAVTAYMIGFQKRSSLLVYGGGVLAALAILMKFTNLLVLVLLLPLFLINRRARWKIILISMLLFAATLLPYIILNILSFGSPFFTFQRAFHVVAEADPAGLLFFLYSLKDIFGLLLVFLVIGVIDLWSMRIGSCRCCLAAVIHCRHGGISSKPQLYLLFCLALTLAYSLFIINRGVAKPAGLEWEAERFLLLPALFAIPFVAAGITSVLAFLAPFFRRYRLCSAVALLLAAALVSLSLYPQFLRSYTPAIAYEDGLREVTKELGAYIRASPVPEFGCIGNCPPLAYYSGKKMSVYYGLPGLAASTTPGFVVFDGNIRRLSFSHVIVKEFCSRSHCAYLLARS